MRRLKSCDVFAGMRLVKAAGMKEELQRIALMTRENKKLKMEEIGAEMILGIMEGLASVGAEQKFYEFVAGPLEMTVAEVENMEFLTLLETLKQYKDVEDQEGWKAFFASVAAVMR